MASSGHNTKDGETQVNQPLGPNGMSLAVSPSGQKLHN